MSDKQKINSKDETTQSESAYIPFETVAEAWLEEKRRLVKETSLAQYRRIVNTVLIPEWQGISISEIDSQTLDNFGEKLYDIYKYRTARNVIATVNQIMEYSHRHGNIHDSRKILSKVKSHKTTLPQVFALSEQKKITSFLMDDFDSKKLGVLICMYSGLRLGEICGLKWSDIDLNKGTIKINRTIQRVSDGDGGTYFLIGTPKSDYSEREIPIPDFLMPLLSRAKKGSDCYVITGELDFMQPRTYQNVFKRYLKECGVSEYHFHTLRHTFASRAIELGFDPKSLSEILGHANVRITLDLYVHPSFEAKKREMDRFSTFVTNSQK